MDTQAAWTLTVGVLAVVVGLVAQLQGRAPSWGLTLRGGSLRDGARGLLLAAPLVAVLWAVVVITGLGDPGPGGGMRSVGVAVGVFAYFAVLFAVEEAVFRGLGTGGLATYIGWWPATTVVSGVVGLAYCFAGATTWLAIVSQVLANLVLGLARLRTRRIWAGWAFKVGWNAGMVVLGWPDADYRLDHPLIRMRLDGPAWLTGGGFGAEASLIGIALLLGVSTVIWRTKALPSRQTRTAR